MTGYNPVTGAFTASGRSPVFVPAKRNEFNIDISGIFTATVQMQRSFNKGVSWSPLTAAGTVLYTWTAPASETAIEPEDGVWYSLLCTFVSGTVNYRISA